MLARRLIPFALLALAPSAFADDLCSVDKSALMNMAPQDFDDGEEGWRQISDQEGCQSTAADLISTYRAKLEAHEASLMHHEAQLRAATGETEQAITLLEGAISRTDDRPMVAYHKAEIAFLKADYEALIAAREELASVPKPEGFDEANERFRIAFPDHPPAVWPMNLDVVDDFIACFDSPYSEAYWGECKTVSGE